MDCTVTVAGPFVARLGAVRSGAVIGGHLGDARAEMCLRSGSSLRLWAEQAFQMPGQPGIPLA